MTVRETEMVGVKWLFMNHRGDVPHRIVQPRLDTGPKVGRVIAL